MSVASKVTLAIFSFVAATIVHASTACGASWPDEYRSGQFFFHADFNLAPYRQLLDGIPKQQQEVLQLLRLKPSNEAIHVFLFRQKSTYQLYMREYFPNIPARKAIFIKGVGGPGMVFAYFGNDFEVDLRHESTHAILNAALPMVPLWLDEGLAEYFEVAAEDRAASSPHYMYIKLRSHVANAPKLETLESMRDLNAMGRTQYRNSWAWVHFMIHGPREARDELSRYLSDIQSHTPPGKLSKRLRNRLPDLDRKFARHFTTWEP